MGRPSSSSSCGWCQSGRCHLCIGTLLANPNRPCVCYLSDGGLNGPNHQPKFKMGA